MKVIKMKINRDVIIWSIAILLVSILIFRGCMNKAALNSNYKITDGRVLDVHYSSFRGISYKYLLSNNEFEHVGTATPKCRNKVNNKLKIVQQHSFPVVYSPSSPKNSEILLFKSQYEKYGVDIPEELREIVAELSKCEE